MSQDVSIHARRVPRNRIMRPAFSQVFFRGCLGLTVLFLMTSAEAQAQGTKADYERAAGLAAKYWDQILDSAPPPEWIDDGPCFWYQVLREDRREFMVVDPQKVEKKPAFDHVKLAAALEKASGNE